MDTEDGVKSVKIIREFLEYFDLNFTAAVFDEEVLRGRHYDYCGPSEFLEDFEHVSGNLLYLYYCIFVKLYAVYNNMHMHKYPKIYVWK